MNEENFDAPLNAVAETHNKEIGPAEYSNLHMEFTTIKIFLVFKIYFRN